MRRDKRLLPLAVGAGSLLIAASSQAMGPLRCDGRLIQPGVSAAYVLSQCGEPQMLHSTTGPVRAAVPGGFTRLAGIHVAEIWVYDRGYGRFPAELHFREGVLRRIEYQPHRSRQQQEPDLPEQ